MKRPSGTEKGSKKGKPAEMPTHMFLQKDMVAAAQKPVVYDLAEVFRGAGKNRGLKLILLLLIFAGLLLGGTFGITSHLESQNKNIAIAISDFEDINMQELLYSLRNAGKLLADMRHNMDLMKGEMDLAMRRLRLKTLQDLEDLKKRHNLTQAQREAMAKKILEDRERRIASMNAEYDARLKDKERSIEEVKLRMGDDKVKLQQTMSSYVGKLEGKLKDYQGESKATKANAELLLRQMGENYALKRQEEKKELEKKLLDAAVRMKKLDEFLKTASLRAGEIEALLTDYRKALMHYAFMRGEQGHVLCVKKNGRLLVVLNPIVEMEKACKGLVIDRKGSVIARIEISAKDGLTHGVVRKKLSRTPISPFDTIIVQKE